MKHVWLILLMALGFTTNAQNDRLSLLQESCRKFDSDLVAKDTAGLQKLLTDHFRIRHSNGFVETKKELLQHLSEGFLIYDEITENGKAEMHQEEELGFVTRYLKVEGSLKGTHFNVNLKVEELWTWDYKKRLWQLRNRESEKTN